MTEMNRALEQLELQNYDRPEDERCRLKQAFLAGIVFASRKLTPTQKELYDE